MFSEHQDPEVEIIGSIILIAAALGFFLCLVFRFSFAGAL